VSFLAPAALGLLALLPVIVAMYLLKLRRPEREIPSVYLWRRMVRDVEANAPWQKLKANLLLILQLLFLLALIAALARPFTWAEGAGGQATILILDTSASMAATDVAPNRLQAAKDQARRLVDGLPQETRVTIVAAGREAQVLAASSRDRRQVHQAIERIQAEHAGSDLSVALELASAMAARQPDTEIVVLSDGRAELPQHLALKGHLRYLPIGISGENQAISLLTLQPSPGGSTLTAFAQVSNYGETTAQRRISFYGDGQLLDVYDLEIQPSGQQAVLAADLPVGSGQIEARLDEQAGDILPVDDRAFAVLGDSQPAPITLVTEGNLFLETALSLMPGIELTLADSPDSALPQDAQLTIFDNTAPISATLPAGNLLFIAPPRSTSYFTTTGTVEAPSMRAVATEDPLLAHVSLAEASLLDAVRIPLPDWAQLVVTGDLSAQDTQPGAEGSTPLIFRGQVDGRRLVVFAFDLRHSDLPLTVAFPILWANTIQWLAPGSAGEVPLQITPGESLTFNVPPEIEAVRVTRPDGATSRLAAQSGRVTLAQTDDLGLYQVQWGDDQGFRLAVNLFLPQESDLKPADNLPGLGQDEAQAGLAPQQARREWWRWLALAALVILTGEWLVYQRSALVRLRDTLMNTVSGDKR
jgi:Ca-activated chloride channel family protein